VWGEEDRVIPAAYAHEFGKRIRGSRVELIANCGHIPQVEQMQATLDIVSSFLL
jgi:pimeloyl-ACP methyl ester carboxylesterase